MSTAVTRATHPQAVAPTPASPPVAKAKDSAPKPQSPVDTVQVSNAAKAALQEMTETRSQTVQEAARGDSQARRLLARETTSK
jgi:hypothetical protein